MLRFRPNFNSQWFGAVARAKLNRYYFNCVIKPVPRAAWQALLESGLMQMDKLHKNMRRFQNGSTGFSSRRY
jgi:hypothetical protein